MVQNATAISTRVAPSFLRVGQIELFARRARNDAHPEARHELQLIVQHLIERNYRPDIDPGLPFHAQVVALGRLFRERLTSLVANWMRVGYCQGNFNSDNCAAGGYTLDYGPFGFCELFDPRFQPWTGGGSHFCFFNQPVAAETNFKMLWMSLRTLVDGNTSAQEELDALHDGFAAVMQNAVEAMWASKLGLPVYDESLVMDLLQLMASAKADYCMIFRLLSTIPSDVSALTPSFYLPCSDELAGRWQGWLNRWRCSLQAHGNLSERSAAMQRVNPAITWREWLIAPAYQRAERGDPSLIHELQQVFSNPYDDPTDAVQSKYGQLRPRELFNAGGISHYSCSS